ncbi:MAG: DsbA family oxidoreductase [Alphaproteobacteria bacterium]|jgi:predicted DsbA family dithiol-disulfide isomerase
MPDTLELSLDVFADPICPWCFIGKRNLERALATYEGPTVAAKIQWRTFMLNPGMPPEGMDRRAYLEAKFGGPENAKAVYGRIKQAGLASGLTLEFDKIGRTPSTRPAHRAVRHVQLTEGHERAEAFVEALFNAYFTEGRDIGQVEVLLEVALGAGVNPDVLWAMFESDAHIEEINAEDVQAREMGMGGVPGFIVNRKYFLSGAQPAAAFHKLFDLIAETHARELSADGAQHGAH